jgi:KRAB domain-containing zinc finger protein
MSHPCKYCTYSSTSSIGLERHVRTHTGEKPFACKYCFVRMALKSNRDRHQKTHTRKMVNALMAFSRQARRETKDEVPPLYLWKNGPLAC